MIRQDVVLGSLTLLLAACSIDPIAPPLLVSGNQPAQMPRERGYVACASAIHEAHAGQRLRLRQRYRSTVLEQQNVRLFYLDGRVQGQGGPRAVHFLCTTERFGRSRLLGLTEIARPLPE